MPLIEIDAALLPYLGTFLFIFAIVFGLLTYSKLLGFSKQVNTLIAIVFGLFSASFEPLRVVLVEFLPIAAIFLVVLFFFVFIKKIFNPEESREPFDAVPILAIAIPALILFGLYYEQVLSFLDFQSRQNVMWLAGISVVVIIFFAVYYHGKETAQKQPRGR